MNTIQTRAVIGACFGDEGKGLVTDWLCAEGDLGAVGRSTAAGCELTPEVRHNGSVRTGRTLAIRHNGGARAGQTLAIRHNGGARAGRTLVIRHNGGAQAGHTVERAGKRFVFHQLSSGSFCHADTLWAETFYPDLYKLGEELQAFSDAAGFIPRIYSEAQTPVTVIDDVLINMGLENWRQKHYGGRHGSCGMGIYEAQLRTEAGFGLKMSALKRLTADAIYRQLRQIRETYVPERLNDLEISVKDLGEYGELLCEDQVLKNTAEVMARNLERVKLTEAFDPSSGSKGRPADAGNPRSFLEWNRIIFEGAQGLLLDSENKVYAPHVTASRTGLVNPLRFCRRHGLRLDQAYYVMRSYVTRHGAGPLPHTCDMTELGSILPDQTNVPNPWQGGLRFARHSSMAELAGRIRADLKEALDCPGEPDAENLAPQVILVLTHLNETGGMICCADGDIPIDDLTNHPALKGLVSEVRASYVPDGEIS